MSCIELATQKKETIPAWESYIFAETDPSSTLYTLIKHFLFIKTAIYLELEEICIYVIGKGVVI